jgi:hypothetical protein
VSVGAATGPPAAAVSAGPRRARGGWVPAAGLAVLFVVAAVVMARQAVVTDLYPPFLPGGQPTSITRYSGPWLTGAAAAVLAAGVSALAALAGFRRRAAR